MMTCTAIAAALLAAAPGATIATGPLTCPDRISLANATLQGVTLDATGATFLEGMALRNVHGLTIKGGTWGRNDRDTAQTHVIRADEVTDFSISAATVLGNSNIVGGGVSIRRPSARVTVRDSRFHGHHQAIGLTGVEDFLIARNTITGATSDGINVVDSQRGIVSANLCTDFNRIPPSHADCIQLWSIAGRPLQADVYVVNNAGIGDMQGILSSDPKTGSGRRLFFHGNYMAVTRSHTITCGACVESVATDNVLASYPGSLWGIGRLKGFEHPSNMVARNVMADGTKTLPPRIWWYGDIPLAGTVGSAFDDRSHLPVEPKR